MPTLKSEDQRAEHSPETLTLDREVARHVQIPFGHLAKSVLINSGHRRVLIVMKGGLSIDNRKFRSVFGRRPAMLSASVVERATGFPVDAISPIGLSCKVPVCLDLSLRAFAWIYLPADKTGRINRISPSRLAELFDATWVDVTKKTAIG